MNDTDDLGWRLTLDDEMSAALENVSAAWGRAVENASTAGTRIVHAVAGMEERFRTLSASAGAAATRGLGAYLRAAGALTGQSALAGAILGGPMGWIGLLGQATAAGVRAGAELDALRGSFASMLGGADAARTHLRELQEWAVGKPWEFSFVAAQSRTLQTFGFRAAEVRGLLDDIGDAASGAATGVRGFGTIARVMGQIQATGRITRGQLSELTNAGVAAFDIMRERLSLTPSQLENIARSGIPAERVLTALREGMRARFGGAMAQSADTLGTKLSDLGDVAGNLARSLYETLGPALKPWLTSLTAWAGANQELFGSVVGGAIVGSLRLLAVVGLPVVNAFRAAARGAAEGADTSFGRLARTFGRVALVLEGVTALVSGDNGAGQSSIGAALKRRLEAAGLWEMSVRLARLAGLIRETLRGMFEGVAQIAGGRLGTLGRVFGFLTGAADGIGATRAQARELGHTLARVAGLFLALGGALRVVRWASGAVGALVQASTALRVAWGFLAAHPLILALSVAALALGGLYLYARRNKQVMDALRGAWSGLTGAFAPIVDAFRAALPALKQGAGEALSTFAGAARTALDALRPAWPVLRLIGSALAVVGYLAAVAFGRVMKGAAGVAVAPVVAIARAVGTLAGLALPYLREAGVRAFLFFARFASVAGPALARLWPVFRLIGSVVAVVVVGAFVALYRVAAWTFDNVIGRVGRARGAFGRIFASIGQTMRDTFAPLVEFVSPIFEAIASAASRVFGGVLDRLLGMLRSAAGALVRAFEGLPPELQPAALRGAISNLRAFSSGKGLTANDAKDAAVAAAPAPADPNAAGRALVNERRAAPSRGVARLERAHQGLAMHLMAAPATPVTVHVEAPPVILDGRRVDEGMQRRRTSETLRAGGTVPSR